MIGSIANKRTIASILNRRKPRHSSRLSSAKGFSLAEMLVALLITSITTAMLYGVFSSQYRFFLLQQEVTEMNMHMNSALKIMTHDFQLGATVRPGDPPMLTAFQFTNDADPGWNEVEISRDTNFDGDTTDTNETVLYRVSGGRLLRNGIELLDNVTDIRFKAYDKNGNFTGTAGQEVYVTVTITAQGVVKKSETSNLVSTRSSMAGARIFARTSS